MCERSVGKKRARAWRDEYEFHPGRVWESCLRR